MYTTLIVATTAQLAIIIALLSLHFMLITVQHQFMFYLAVFYASVTKILYSTNTMSLSINSL